jgi:hypothetical protein
LRLQLDAIYSIKTKEKNTATPKRNPLIDISSADQLLFNLEVLNKNVCRNFSAFAGVTNTEPTAQVFSIKLLLIKP